MRPHFGQIIIALLVGSVCAANPCAGQTDRRLASVKLSDLSFISGLWQTNWNNGRGEESWSPALGDSMIGTFRFVKDEKARFYELMLIEQGV